MGSFDGLWSLPGPVVAALIAGFISFVVTVLAKDQKTSEFRQAWIDGLRADVSEFSGAAFAMASVLRAKKSRGEDLARYILDRHDDFAKMEGLTTKIHLRLNPKEHIKIISLLKRFSDGTGKTTEELDKVVAEIVNAVHGELGSEWRRVKRGEPSFRILKWLSFCVVLAGVLVGLTVAYHCFIQ